MLEVDWHRVPWEGASKTRLVLHLLLTWLHSTNFVSLSSEERIPEFKVNVWPRDVVQKSR